jgi:hypothetical protein
MDGWIDVWMEGRKEGIINVCMYMCVWTNYRMDGWIVSWMNG